MKQSLFAVGAAALFFSPSAASAAVAWAIGDDFTVSDSTTYADTIFQVFGQESDSSILTLTPGSVIGSAQMFDYTELHLLKNPETSFGGNVVDDVFIARGTSKLTMDAGFIGGDLVTQFGGTSLLRSGTIVGNLETLSGAYTSLTGATVYGEAFTFADATLFIGGGSIAGNISALDNSLVNFEGYTGTYTGELSTDATGSLHLYGSDLTLTGNHLTGTLTNGGTLDATVTVGSTLYLNSVLTPVLVPEPAAATLGLLALSLTTLRRRRH